MTRPIYKVSSTYPPALSHHPGGGLKIVAGTIQSITVGKFQIPADSMLPAHTTVDQLEWVRPAVGRRVAETTRTVQGAKGATYTVTTLPSGRQTCTCPGYTFRKTCRHLTSTPQ